MTDNHVLLSSRVRLARNIAGKPFSHNAPLTLLKEMRGQAAGILEKNGYRRLDMENLPETDRQLLQERHLVSRELAENVQSGAALITEDEQISVLLNEEDHIRIQAFSRQSLADALTKAREADALLAAGLTFAKDKDWGYITCCPTNLGTGMRASVMLHLPALTYGGKINQVMQEVAKLGMTVRGMFGEGSQAEGCIYQVSNRITMGVEQRDIVSSVNAISDQVLGLEKDANRFLFENAGPAMRDKAFRALGILRFARMLSKQEFLQLYAEFSLGYEQGLFTGRPDNFESLLNSVQAAALSKAAGYELKEDLRDKARAKIIRDAFSGISAKEDA